MLQRKKKKKTKLGKAHTFKVNSLAEPGLIVMKIKAQRIRDARAFTTYIETSILIMENSDLGGCETLETPNIFLFPSVLSLLLF